MVMDAGKTPMKTTTYSKKSHWSDLALVYIASFALLFQPLTPAIGAILSDSYIQDQLNSYSYFEPSDSVDYQLQEPSYLQSQADVTYSLDNFVDTISSDYGHILSDKGLVPIGVGGITTFVPNYKKPKLVGTPAVQSRYIETQVKSILGRTLINVDADAYRTKNQQSNTLYSNAFRYIDSQPTIRYGQKLNLDQDNSGLAYDMIWPEFRYINDEEVVVPIVYLSKNTIDTRRVEGNVVEVAGNTSVGSLVIDGVDIQLGRETFLQVAGDLINNQGSITSSGQLDIVAGGGVLNLSGLIQSGSDLSIAANTINNETLLYRFYDKSRGYVTQGTRYGQVAGIDAEGSLTLRSYDDIIFRGATASAGGTLTLATDGSIFLGSQQLQSTRESYFNDSYSGSDISFLRSSLTATDTISLIAQGSILIDAADIVSDQGHLEILAGLGVTIEDDLSQSQFLRTFSGGQESRYKTVAMRALLDAGRGIRIHSELGDITLRATDIRSTEGTSIVASNGAVNLLMTVENDHYRYNRVKKSLFTVKTINRGHDIETGVPNSIVGGLVVEAVSGLTVEFSGDPSLSLDDQVANLAQFEGLEWMADVRADHPNADWQAIELQYREWNETRRSLSPAFAAFIAIVVAVVVGPAVGEALGATSGAAATATAAAIPATSAGVLGSTVLGAATVATATSLATAAALAAGNAAVNGDNPIKASFEAISDDDTLKSAAVAAITAGAINALDADFFNAVGDTPFDVFVDVETGAATLSLAGQATQAVTQAVVSAGIQNVIAGGDFDDAFVQSLTQQGINRLGKYSANKIKEAFDVGGTNESQLLRYISHAGVGCVLGAVTAETTDADRSNSCASGLGGAVIGELIADNYRAQAEEALEENKEKVEGFLDQYGFTDPSQLSGAQLDEFAAFYRSDVGLSQAVADFSRLRQDGINIARVGAALGAFIASADAAQINIAADAGQNAAENNAFFLIPVAIFLLKAADIAFTVYELNELKDNYDAAGDNEEAKKAVLREYFGDKVEEAVLEIAVTEAFKRLLPGASFIAGVIDIAVERGIISRNTVDRVRSAFGSDSGNSNGSEVNAPSKVPVGNVSALTPIDNYIDITNGRSGHILANHRAGAGKPDKTEFPSGWDDQRIIHQVSDIATDPALIRRVDNRGTPFVEGTRDGLDIKVIFFPDNHARAGQISSAFPLNVTVNPR